MGLLSLGHLATDYAAGSLPALLVFLDQRYSLSNTLVAALMLAATVSSSVVQPLFGLISDKRGALWLIPAGIGTAGLCMGLIGVAPGYWVVFVLVLVGGLGVAAFHPEGAKFAAYASGPGRARGMSYFNVGGNLGYALGAAVTTPLVVWLGLSGGALALLPVLIVAGALLRAMPSLARVHPPVTGRGGPTGSNRPWAMAQLGVVIVLRSVTWFALLTFVPLWWVAEGHSKVEGNRVLVLMLFVGAAGTLILGPVADRIGLRRTLWLTQAVIGPLTAVFVLVGGAIGVVAVSLVGLCVVGTFGVTMVMSQQYLPRSIGMASGLSIGLAMGLGGVAAVVLGAVADAIDLRTALLASAVAPALGTVLVGFLPPGAEPRQSPTAVPEAATGSATLT